MRLGRGALAGGLVWAHGSSRVVGLCQASHEHVLVHSFNVFKPLLCARTIPTLPSSGSWLIASLLAFPRSSFPTVSGVKSPLSSVPNLPSGLLSLPSSPADPRQSTLVIALLSSVPRSTSDMWLWCAEGHHRTGQGPVSHSRSDRLPGPFGLSSLSPTRRSLPGTH